jgi:hypothetical protein
VDPFARWLDALERRHLADLRFADLARGIRALSSAYVERRAALDRGRALEGRAKRAAFALFYGPLHFLVVRHVVRALGTAAPLRAIADLGCGGGAAGAAWALEIDPPPPIVGIDRHPWALAETRWTYRVLGVRGRVARTDLARLRLPGRGAGIVAAFTLNELEAGTRATVLARLLAAARRGARVLVVEPIAGRVVPWWREWTAAVVAAGGRADEWRFALELPEVLARFDRAAGLDHRVLTARSTWLG